MKEKKLKLNSNNIYLFLVPAVVLVFIFNYLPMVGILMAFQDYNIFAGSNPIDALFNSPWVGLENFRILLTDPKFLQVFKNTLEISFLKIVFTFPLPVITAVLLNELYNLRFKKIVQTIVYMPHFLSWVIVGGIWMSILGGNGFVNNFLLNHQIIGSPIPFMINNWLFRVVLIVSSAWKEIGWSTIIYLAAITSIDYQLYEAVKIDGGSKWHEIKNITIPCLLPTVIMMFILNISSVMDAGFDQIFNMYSPYVYQMNDVISTYVYRLGIGGGEYSMATAIGLFNSVIGFTLLITANYLARKYAGKSIW